jgi:hypothetical protein
MHDYWIKDYRKIRATDEYRAFCKDIIEELYEVFEAPRYIHLGLDEEFPDRAKELGFRTGDVLFNDYKFLINVVKELGSTPMMWASTCMHTMDVWEKHIPDDMIFAAGHYYEFEKEKWTKIADQSPWVQKYYWDGMFENRSLYKKYVERYGNTKIEYVEQDETVQMYIRDMVASVVRPLKELKGFEKISLEPGESKTVSFKITSDMLKIWDINMKHVAEPGMFRLFIGHDSRVSDFVEFEFLCFDHR